MGVINSWWSWWQAQKRKRTGREIAAALDRAYAAAPTRTLDARADRLVVFSDHHKGARDGADDFQRSERTYNAALTYYDALGFYLLELGDVEELWENTFEEVAASYPATLQLAAAFHARGGYTRMWGNHDLAWKDTQLFKARMGTFGYDGVAPIEALRLVVDGSGGGELFLVHGHQGTADSDRHATLSRLFVHYGWRSLQRLLDRPWNSPSMDWELRGEHAQHMAYWATERHRVVVAGHTHLPVFFGHEKPLPAPPEQDDGPTDTAEAEALSAARAEWAKAELERLKRQRPIPLTTPCYFNTGCCSFGDGDITGIELADGQIRLVRWPCDPQTERVELAAMELDEVFAATRD